MRFFSTISAAVLVAGLSLAQSAAMADTVNAALWDKGGAMDMSKNMGMGMNMGQNQEQNQNQGKGDRQPDGQLKNSASRLNATTKGSLGSVQRIIDSVTSFLHFGFRCTANLKDPSWRCNSSPSWGGLRPPGLTAPFFSKFEFGHGSITGSGRSDRRRVRSGR